MSGFDTEFNSYIKHISEEEIREKGHVVKQVLQIEKPQFGSEIADYVSYCSSIGQVVIVHMVQKVNLGPIKDEVIWAKHQNIESGDIHFQVACSHTIEYLENDQEELTLSCSGLAHGLRTRASVVQDKFLIRQVLNQYREARGSWRVDGFGRVLVMDMVESILQRMKIHPEGWMANIESGSHLISALSAIFDQDYEDMKDIIAQMESEGRIVTEQQEFVYLPS